MGPVEAAIIITVCLYWAVNRSRAEYGHVRDKHLGQIQKDHPDWSPRRQRRLAKHRARGYWAHQIGNGFPDMRNAFKENRELAKVERAEAEAAGAKRWADYRRRLEAAQAEREKYVADQVSTDPEADKTAARKSWFDRHKLAGALRAGATATKLELGADRTKADQPHRPPQVSPPDEPPSPDREGRTRRVGEPADPTAPGVPCAYCGTRNGDRYMRRGSLVCGGCLDLARAREDLRDAQKERSGEGDRSRLEQRVERLSSEQNRRRAAAERQAGTAATRRPESGTPRREPRRCATCNAPLAGREFLCAGCTELGELTAHIRDLKSRRDAATDPAERDRIIAELRRARQRRNDLHRAMEARKTNDGRTLAPVNDQADADSGPRATSAQRWRCDRGGQLADKLYPMPGPDGAVEAVCGTCAEGGNCGDPINGQPGSRTCDGCGNAFDNLFALARHPNGRLLCGPCADAAAATPGSPGDQADPVYAPDEDTTTNSPPTEGGADHDTNTTGGNPVEAPNIETARANATSVAAQIGVVAAGCEQMEADLLAGGLGNDQAALAKFAAAKEALLTAQAAFTEFVTELNKHAAGEEYANTGHAAKTEFLTHA